MLPHTTGGARLDAQSDFARARRAHFAGRTFGWLRSRPCVPRTLPDAAALPGGVARLKVIPLDSVVDTLEPTIAFERSLSARVEVVRGRWERVALAHRQGVALPPLTVRQGPDGYYVSDGRHRVSVARTPGLRDIEAWVTDTHHKTPSPLVRAA